MKIRVYYEDTDAMGIVYHANYFKFCERARSELFLSIGIDMKNEKGFLVVKTIEANYIKPAYLGDILELDQSVDTLRKSSVVVKQNIYCKNEKIFELRIRLVYIEDMMPAIMPNKYYNFFEEYNEKHKDKQ